MLAGSDFRVPAKPFKALPGASLLEIPLQFGGWALGIGTWDFSTNTLAFSSYNPPIR